jgi:L-fucose isomerase-like protein
MTSIHLNHPSALTPTIGFACLARPTFAVAYAREAAMRALAALATLNWPVVGHAALLMDAQSAQEAALALSQHSPDVLVLLCATFSDASMALELAALVDAPLLLWALREPGPVGDRLWLNSLCGATLASHALHQTGRITQYLYGDPEEAGILAPLAALARAAVTRKRLRTSRLGLLGQAPTGFFSCQFDELALERVIGTKVVWLDLTSLFSAASAVPAAAVEAVIASTAERSPSLLQLRQERPVEVQHFGEVSVVLQAYLRTQRLDGLALRCWPEFPQQFGLMPCATLGRLADEGFVCACEADLHGAVTLLALQWLSGAAPLLADIVAMDGPANTVTLWHCGNAAACLAREGEEALLTVHCNRRIGVAGNFAIRPGPATLARLGVGPGGYRLLVVGGELLDEAANRFMGNTALFHPQGGAQQLLNTIMEDGWEHHVAVVAGHLVAELKALARLLGIEAVTI